jgi:hypothetical protein
VFYIISLLNHLKHIKVCMAEMGGEAHFDVKDLSLRAVVGDEARTFLPQFSYLREGRRLYTPTFGPPVSGFIGWRPYLARSWPLSSEKLAFKAHVEAVGLRTPQSWQTPSADVSRFIVKKNRSSFGDGIRGPYARLDAANPAHRLADGEYYEAFIGGRIAKAWYWNGELVCLELRPPPFVVGDGRATVLELASRRAQRVIDQLALASIAAAQGHRLDDVLPEGKRLVADFKYASYYYPPCFDNENVLAKYVATPIGQQLAEAGRVLQQAIPDDIRADTLFTLDAAVDAEDRVFLLEMNSNPWIHPDTYPAMLRSAFGAGAPAPSFAGEEPTAPPSVLRH